MSVVNFAEPASLKDNIWISLNMRRGAFFQRPDFGSDLHLLRRDKLTPRTPKTAVGMSRRALAWLVAQEKAISIEPTSFVESTHRLRLDVRVIGANSQPVDLTTFIPVGVIPS